MHDISVPAISVIIVTYNSEHWIEACLKSIIDQPYRNYEIIVVDNASSDRTREIVGTYIPAVILESLADNLGFGAGMNLGASKARGRILFLLNPDAKIDEACLEAIVRRYETFHGILAVTQLSYDGSTHITAGNAVDVFGYPAGEIAGKCFYADGAALCIEREALRKLGGFDEDMFLFHEEVDLCWRAHLLGIPVESADDAIVMHESGGVALGGAAKGDVYVTTAFRRYHGEKNILRNLLKNYEASTLLWVVPLYVLQLLAEVVVLTALRSSDAAKADLSALCWNVVHLRETLARRRGVQQARLCSDASVRRNMIFAWAKFMFFRERGFPKFVRQRP